MKCICTNQSEWFSIEENLTNNLESDETLFTFEKGKEYDYEVKKDFGGNLYIVKHLGKNFIAIPEDVFNKGFKIKD